MIPHDSTDLRALEEHRRDTIREIDALRRGAIIKNRVRLSMVSHDPDSSVKLNKAWWTGLCGSCGRNLEIIGKRISAQGRRLRESAEHGRKGLSSTSFQA